MRSNCLFEAIKAKIKNPSVKVFLLPKQISDFKHFMWCDENYYYHAFNYTNSKNKLFFPVKYKKVPRIIFESWVLSEIDFCSVSEKTKIMKKVGFKSFSEPNKWGWHIEEFVKHELPSFDENQKYTNLIGKDTLYKVNINGEFKIVNWFELIKIRTDFEWKLVDPYDSDYERAYRNHKGSTLSDIQN